MLVVKLRLKSLRVPLGTQLYFVPPGLTVFLEIFILPTLHPSGMKPEF